MWVTDFGLAKAAESEDLTSSGDVVGTLRYIPPERFRGESDPRGDVYSLGITLYELATLRPACTDSDRARLMERVTHEEPPRPRKLDRQIPRDLETIVLKAIDKDASFDDEDGLTKLAQNSRIRLEPTMGGNRTLLDGHDISSRIRERDVTEAASRVSVHPRVREWMVARQREMGEGGGVVMEGRDIGTKVFPDADLKIFLDADPVVREQRRMEQQRVKGEVAAGLAAELRERDRRDRTRAVSPLVAAKDAVLIDSTQLSEDEVVARVEELVKKKLNQRD